ncbi:MAG TPA: hypothetical protein VHA82_19480 [Ramlibacter sp.]|uniref:hypothetical protein n=1 Tax=Ramlibacter sp. TaxID=1917967 RepID=UPI002BEAB96A|nr:hypothetical protein [Ramlibacter sp.]HVZ45999.1 hypothetical protein [Ramlibacter sp.]
MLIYRLKQWPQLADRERTARILSTLSVMSNRPVNRRWMLSNSKLPARELDPLLEHWIESGWVEVIDPSRFA